MKICLTANSSPWSRFKGGGQIAVHHLACALSRKGHEVHAVYSKSPNESLSPQVSYKIHWARHHDFATINLNFFSFARVLSPLAAKEKFDIIHGNAEEACYGGDICRRNGAAFVFTSHAPSIPNTGMIRGMMNPLQFLKTVNTYLLRKTAGEAKRIITFSRFSKNLVVDSLGQEWESRVEVIPPGIEASWFNMKRKSDSHRHLVFWGRIEAEKGLSELFQAVKTVSGKFPDLKLSVIGEGNRLEPYKKQVEELGISSLVSFPGWMDTEQIQERVQGAGVAVFPSRVESFGLSLAEALAAGIPIIASRAGAIPDTVEDGRTGTLVPARDIDALSKAITDCFVDPLKYETLARQGKEIARQKFSWDQAAEKTIGVYEKVRATHGGKV